MTAFHPIADVGGAGGIEHRHLSNCHLEMLAPDYLYSLPYRSELGRLSLGM